MSDVANRVIQELFFSAKNTCPSLRCCIPRQIPSIDDSLLPLLLLYILFLIFHVYVYPILTYCTGPRQKINLVNKRSNVCNVIIDSSHTHHDDHMGCVN